MRSPEVSIGMPVYNGEKFLAQALDSLLAQTLTDFELIISDNGSTDATEEICCNYARRDPRIRYIRHPVNRGATWNWNYVVHEARGEFLKWASANDYCDPRMLERCVEALRSDPQVVLSYPLTVFVDEDGAQERYLKDIDVIEERPSDRFVRIRAFLEMNNAQSGVIRLSALRRTQLERSYAHGDMIMMAELALYGKYRLVQEPLFFRRVDRDSMSRHLAQADLQRFLAPKRNPRFALQSIRQHLDSAWSVLRASIGVREKARALTYVLKRAYWERHGIFGDIRALRGRARVSDQRAS